MCLDNYRRFKVCSHPLRLNGNENRVHLRWHRLMQLGLWPRLMLPFAAHLQSLKHKDWESDANATQSEGTLGCGEANEMILSGDVIYFSSHLAHLPFSVPLSLSVRPLSRMPCFYYRRTLYNISISIVFLKGSAIRSCYKCFPWLLPNSMKWLLLFHVTRLSRSYRGHHGDPILRQLVGSLVMFS